MQTLTNRLKPLLSGAVSLDELDDHTRQALAIYVHFRASALLDLPKDQMKAEVEKLPECVKGLVRAECKRLLEHRRLFQNSISRQTT